MAQLASPYNEDVARVYDLLVYGEPRAQAGGHELAFLRWALEQVCVRPVEDVLDVGCGTGYHLAPLARAGYRVTGLDCSAHMLRQCRRKLDAEGLEAELLDGNMEELEAEGRYDAVLCMNSILCYLVEAEGVVDVLRRLGRALRPGGLLVADNCNFFAQWRRLEEDYGEVREAEGVRIDYHDRHWYEDFASIYHVEIEAAVREPGRRWRFHSDEGLRAMTVGELRAYLREAGFEQVESFPSFDVNLKDETSGERMIFLAARAT
ncbi:MAG: methyltransferase domain-containing protein [Planctomycetes bacterium]|nr:methyltransferase domain-containing protein [Planctomycetota bacterium]